MAIRVVEKRSSFTPAHDKGVVAVESDGSGPPFDTAFHELQDKEAVILAMGYAARRGMASPRLNGNVKGPYPVNSDGVPLDEVKGPDGKSFPATHPKMRPAKYAIDVPVCAPVM